MGPRIRHVRHADFIALASGGVADLEGFRRAVDALVDGMGTLAAHHCLFDLRGASVGPLPEIVLVEALEYMRRRRLGVENRVALLVDADDSARVDLGRRVEEIAGHMGLALRAFVAYDQAEDWLFPDESAPHITAWA